MPESNETGRASGVINTAAREAMAREKARVFGPRAGRPSALEEAADRWEIDQQARARGAADQRLEISRQAEAPIFSLQRVSLQPNGSGGEDDVGWKIYRPPSQEKKRRRQGRIGHIPLMSMAQQVIRRERASAKGGGWTNTDRQARALEEAARRWAAGQPLGISRR
ncbi:MAG: hypothetical protein ACE5Q6_22695 [Dehalococcoidia bacterium]